MNLYINGISAISPQDTFNSNDFLSSPVDYNDRILKCVTPNYKEYINPRQLRRMSAVVKMGIATAKQALAEASVELPDAIVTGTGMGCEADTEKFLDSIVANNESLLTPTAFIQSTHNTVASQIALNLSCNNYNMTYVNRNGAFESALIDAAILANEGKNNILAGGLDEMTKRYHYQRDLKNFWKKEEIASLSLFDSKTSGTLAGEGSVFAVLSNQKTSNYYARLIDVASFIDIGKAELSQELNKLLQKHNISQKEIDVVITGNTGNYESDKFIDEFVNTNLQYSVQLTYKHLTGEYDTASAFAFWLAANILKKQTIPKVTIYKSKPIDKIKYVLIYNYHYYFKNNHNFILLKS